MSILGTITTGRTPSPPRLLIYGGDGVGKSTFAAGAPSPVFIQTEEGIDQIDAAKFPLTEDWLEVQAQIEGLRTEDHDFKTLVIDHLSRLELAIWQFVADSQQVETIELVDGGFSKGYTRALIHWKKLTSDLDMLRRERRMTIILLAHDSIIEFKDPEGQPYDQHSPRLHKKASSLIREWVDCTGYAYRRVRKETTKEAFGAERTTAHAVGQERQLRVDGRPSCVAKNRYALTDDLPLDFAALVAAIKAQRDEEGGEA